MSKAKVAEALREIGIIATVRVPNEEQLLRGIAALTDGGIRAVELPYTTVRGNGWLIQHLREDGLLIGVGAVTRSAQAREAGVLGAEFITASVTAPDVVLACNEMDVPCILSGITPTEVWRAHEMAADFVKITAAEPLGGPHYIRSLLEMLPAVRLVSADMTLDGHASYLEAGVEVLEFKSALAFPELVEREAWAELSQGALEVVEARNNWRVNQSSTKVRGSRPLPRGRVGDLVSAETLATTSSTGPTAGLETWALWRAWYERQRAEETEAAVIPAAPCECPARGEETD